jgi:hypothetical protein
VKNFQRIAQGVDVIPLLNSIQRQPRLWDEFKWRTTYKNTPHVDVSDIWLRYSNISATSDIENTEPVTNDTTPIFYPAWNLLPQVRPIIFDLMRRVEAFELGRVLITKIPSGGKILPHRDATGAYTDQDDGIRYHVVLQGLPGSLFRADDETVNMQTGEVWSFNHLAEHEVINNSADDRIHLLVDLKLA